MLWRKKNINLRMMVVMFSILFLNKSIKICLILGEPQTKKMKIEEESHKTIKKVLIYLIIVILFIIIKTFQLKYNLFLSMLKTQFLPGFLYSFIQSGDRIQVIRRGFRLRLEQG